MNCPRCSQEAIPATPHCPGCGLTLHSLDSHFGGTSVLLERLIDAAHCLKLREKEAIEEQLLGFERRFPQLFASVYIGTLPEWTNVAEFGFWFLNRGTISNTDSPRDNRHTFLLVLDPDMREAGLTLGYAAEQILQPKGIARSLQKGRVAWRAGEYLPGLIGYLGQLSKELRRACRKIPGARRALADRLDTLPPPDLSSRPVSARSSGRSDVLEPSRGSRRRPAVAPTSSFVPASSRLENQLDLTGGVTFAHRSTAAVS